MVTRNVTRLLKSVLVNATFVVEITDDMTGADVGVVPVMVGAAVGTEIDAMVVGAAVGVSGLNVKVPRNASLG